MTNFCYFCCGLDTFYNMLGQGFLLTTGSFGQTKVTLSLHWPCDETVSKNDLVKFCIDDPKSLYDIHVFLPVNDDHSGTSD